MRHLHTQFSLRHALFALQGPDGYVDALMESARESALAARRRRPLPSSGKRAAAATARK